LSIYSLGPLVGPAVGPIAGAWIAQCTTWRWTLWAPSIVDVFIQLAALKYLRETFAPTLLRHKAARLRKETGDDRYQTKEERANLGVMVALKRGLSRPFILVGTQPIIQFLGLYMAYLYGLYCKLNLYLFFYHQPDTDTNIRPCPGRLLRPLGAKISREPRHIWLELHIPRVGTNSRSPNLGSGQRSPLLSPQEEEQWQRTA